VTADALSYDVRIWSVQIRAGKRGTKYRVRWVVAGKTFIEPFDTRKLADSSRALLLQAASRGEAFDRTTGKPQSQAVETRAERRWVTVAREFIDDRWDDFSPRHRKSTVEGLVTLTTALVDEGQTYPDPRALREALTRWEFNPRARAHQRTPPTGYTDALSWMAEHSLTLDQVGTASGARAALRAVGRKLDGTQASAATAVRKRAALSAVLNFAVESRYLAHSPLKEVRRKREPVTDTVDPRVVVNPDQATGLLDAVKQIAPDLHAFFATLYYAGLRPAEARNLHERDLTLPKAGWGRILLTGGYQDAGTAWTDAGTRGEERELKHRAKKEVRPVPVHPELNQTVRVHLATFGTGTDGRLFVTRTGRGGHPLQPPYDRPVSMSRVYRVWALARERALTPEQVNSPLAARPYDLRHACLSTWLAAGVAPTQVAQWAGHSVEVLLRVYAKCLDNSETVAMERIEATLPPRRERPAGQNLDAYRTRMAVESRIRPDMAGQRRRASDPEYPQVRGPFP
jgi:integrase